MYRFLETMLWDGAQIRHFDFHLNRISASLRFEEKDEDKKIVREIQNSLQQVNLDEDHYRIRLLYDNRGYSIESLPFKPIYPSSFKCVEIPGQSHYEFKYADRQFIDMAFEKRDQADEIIMIRNGWVTDTSKSNLAFLHSGVWYTPYFPLLAGTTWKRLINERRIQPRPIHIEQISLFDMVRSFNALHDFENSPLVPVSRITF